MRYWFFSFLVLFITACSTPGNVIVTPFVEEAIEEQFVEPTATPVCQHASGVLLEVHRISESTARLRASGLQPGENPSVIYGTHDNKGSSMGEMYGFAEGVDDNGEFTLDIPGLVPPEGNISAAWDIRFIHSRGVECATITLP